MIVQTFMVSDVLDKSVPAKGIARPSGDRAIRNVLVFALSFPSVLGSA